MCQTKTTHWLKTCRQQFDHAKKGSRKGGCRYQRQCVSKSIKVLTIQFFNFKKRGPYQLFISNLSTKSRCNSKQHVNPPALAQIYLKFNIIFSFRLNKITSRFVVPSVRRQTFSCLTLEVSTDTQNHNISIVDSVRDSTKSLNGTKAKIRRRRWSIRSTICSFISEAYNRTREAFNNHTRRCSTGFH